MPELPEVETMVRGIRAHMEGRVIEDVLPCPNVCRPILVEPAFPEFAQRLKGRTITQVRRLAKRVVLDLSDESNVAIEPRMTGLMLVADPPDVGHLRVEWRLRDDSGGNRAGSSGNRDLSGRNHQRSAVKSIWFWDRRGLGTVRWYAPGAFSHYCQSGALGPDALSLSADALHALCLATSRPMKQLLLDQKRVAGIGNLYASEILHLAGIHPERPARQLRRDELDRVHAAIIEILETAIRYEGSTLGDGTYRNALNKSGGYQNAHRVYARAGAECLTCRTGIIERIVQGQRSTFFCAVCQPKRRKRHGGS